MSPNEPSTSQSTDSSAPRKSSRARQKKSFGDDFIDPMTADPSDFVSRLAPPKRKSNVVRKNSKSPLDALLIEPSGNETLNVSEDEPPPLEASTTPSIFLKHIVDTVDDKILRPIKIEAEAERIVVRKEERRSFTSNLSTARQNADVIEEMDDELLGTVSPDYHMQPSTTEQDMKNARYPYGRPVANARPPRFFQTYHEMSKHVQQQAMSEQERRLAEETDRKLKEIRAANVRKIIHNRAKGNIPRDSQMQAQNKEIYQYVSTTADTTVFNELPSRKFREGIAREEANTSSSPAVFRLPVRRVAPPPQFRLNPYAPRSPNLPLGGAPRPNQMVERPELQVGQYLRIQMENSLQRKPSRVIPGFAPRGSHRLTEVPLRNDNAIRSQSMKQRVITPRLYENGLLPRLPVKVLTRQEVAAAAIERQPFPPALSPMLDPKMEEEEPCPPLLKDPKQEEPLKKPKNEVVDEEYGQSSSSPSVLGNHSKASPSPYSLSTSTAERAPMLPAQQPTDARKVTKILISRGPNGEIIPKGRIVVRNTQQPQYRKVILAPPPGLVPPPQVTTKVPVPSELKPTRQPPPPPLQFIPIPPNYLDNQQLPPKRINLAATAKLIVRQANQSNVAKNETVKPNEDGSAPVKQELPDDYDYGNVKQEPMDIKEEPLDDYESNGASTSNNDKTDPFQVVYHDEFLKAPQYAPSPSQTVVMPRLKKRSQNGVSLYDMIVRGANRRSTSPHRIFLGAEEPIKDIVPEMSEYGKLFVKQVGTVNREKFNAARQRSPSPDNGFSRIRKMQLQNSGGIRKKSDVMAMSLEEKEEDRVMRQRKHSEYIRQQQAVAQKLILNETDVWQYMQSDQFKDSFYQEREVSRFTDTVGKPNALAELPEYSDSLTHSNPKLFENLLSVYRTKHEQRNKAIRPGMMRTSLQKEASPKPPKAPIPTQITKESRGISKAERMKQRLTDVSNFIEIKWNSKKIKCPEASICHLCSYIMRLCIRKVNYRGQLKSYPAYRCLRKGCQTFRSIKKQEDLCQQGTVWSSPATHEQKNPENPMLLESCKELIDEKPVIVKEEEVDESKTSSMTSVPNGLEAEVKTEPLEDVKLEAADAEEEDTEKDKSSEDGDDIGETVGYEDLRSKRDSLDELDGVLSPYEEDDDDVDGSLDPEEPENNEERFEKLEGMEGIEEVQEEEDGCPGLMEEEEEQMYESDEADDKDYSDNSTFMNPETSDATVRRSGRKSVPCQRMDL